VKRGPRNVKRDRTKYRNVEAWSPVGICVGAKGMGRTITTSGENIGRKMEGKKIKSLALSFCPPFFCQQTAANQDLEMPEAREKAKG
jgi:hypothetical protein